MGGTALQNLQLAIHGVMAPFACEGTLVPDGPVVLVFRDGSRFEVQRAENSYKQKELLKPLLARCKPAPFGEGKTTRYDRNVRDALQLRAEHGAFFVENFDPESAGVLRAIQRALLPHDPNPISAELYGLNIYTDGGHFEPHKDTPRGADMFGTLVVCLPSQFSHGDLVLVHRGVVRKFDWANAIQKQTDPSRLHWAAFFGDVDHQVEHIWAGARVTLTYLLRRGEGGAPTASAGEDLAPRVQEAWRELLADEDFLPQGGTLAYPCCHLYHQDARFQVKQRPITRQSASNLKGRDQMVAATAIEAKLKVRFQPYMFENCADEIWKLEHFPTNQEKARLGRQMDPSDLENALPILASSQDEGGFGLTWIESPPSLMSEKLIAQAGESGLPAAARLHSCEYSDTGYFGNEGSEIDLYAYAALHIEIPPLGQGPRAREKPPKTVRRGRPAEKPKRMPRKSAR